MTMSYNERENLLRELVARAILDGGCTIKLDGSPPPTTGYVVGFWDATDNGCIVNVGGVDWSDDDDDPDKPAQAGDAGQWRRAFEEGLERVLERIRGLDPSTVCLGSWIHRDTNNLWIEPSEVIQDRDEAIRVGTARNQIAIYDLSAKRDIRLR
jgi:hypothetical protein